jgi:nucleotide-binding universal stress UspA family protein
MGYKTIAYYVEGGGDAAARNEATFDLARRFDARLVGVAFAAKSTPPLHEDVALSIEVWREALKQWEQEAKSVAREFEEAARNAGVDEVEGRHATGGPDLALSFATHARYADLAVIGAPRGSEAPSACEKALQAALFDSGRPVLVLPPDGPSRPIGRRVMLAWDAGREAALAAGAALPFLKAADVVQIGVATTFFGSMRHGADPGADAARWLAAHGVNVEVSALSTEHSSAAEALLRDAAAFGADLIVMGGYGQSRLLEAVFGGVTSHMLAESDIPLLLAH